MAANGFELKSVTLPATFGGPLPIVAKRHGFTPENAWVVAFVRYGAFDKQI